MKKKFSAFDIIGLGVISYLICIIFGLVSKHVFNLGDVDILSSSATLFAGIVALILFNDWREQYRMDLMFKLKDSIFNNLTDFEEKLDKFYFSVLNANRGHQFKLNDILRSSLEVQNSYEKLLPELLFLKRVLVQSNIKIESLSENPFELEKKIAVLILKLSGVLISNKGHTNIINGYWEVLKDQEIRDNLKSIKYLLNYDLEEILLKNIF